MKRPWEKHVKIKVDKNSSMVSSKRIFFYDFYVVTVKYDQYIYYSLSK